MSTIEVKEETGIVPTMIQAASQAKIEVSRKATAESDAGPRSGNYKILRHVQFSATELPKSGSSKILKSLIGLIKNEP
jgi:hypothetical protein